MTETHHFLFSPGNWLGQGTVVVNDSKEVLKFCSRWAVAHGGSTVECTQTVEMDVGGEQVVNQLTFNNLESDRFQVTLRNALLGTVEGAGVADERSIGWEFENGTHGFSGFEIYERGKDGEYQMRAEYVSPEKMRTVIKGTLWKEGAKE